MPASMPLLPLPNDAPTLSDVYAARQTMGDRVRHTPLVRAAALSALAGTEVYLKLETLQETGAFKLRGALHCLAHAGPDARQRGVVTVSTGNHGRAVAFAARQLGLHAVVCMSSLVQRNKVAAIEALGAEIRIAGNSQDEAYQEALRLVVAQGRMLVPPFDDPHILAGQGTIGLEIAEHLPDVDTVLVPLSGGGLIGGIALAMKAIHPAVRVVGISIEHGAAMIESLRAGRPVQVEERPSLADSLGGGIGLDNRYTLPLVQRHVDDVLTLSEAEIAAGMRHLFHEERIVAEGAGAVCVAAILAGKAGALGRQAVCVVSGGNVDMDEFLRVVAGGTP